MWNAYPSRRGRTSESDSTRREAYAFQIPNSKFLARAGFAYQITDKTVLRGGVGIYTIPNIIFGNYQPGFSQSTSIVPTLDNGLTLRASLTNPFPDGVIDPSGASRGADTFLGQDFNNVTGGQRFVPVDFKNGQNGRYMLTLQRELPGQWLFETGYAGSRGWNLTTGGGNQAGEIDLNGIPAQFLSTSRQRDQATSTSSRNSCLIPSAVSFRGLASTVRQSYARSSSICRATFSWR